MECLTTSDLALWLPCFMLCCAFAAGQTIGSLITGSGGAQLTNIQCAVSNVDAAAQG